MKNKLIFLLVFLFWFSINGYCQKKLVISGDTLIAITPKNLGTINGIIEEYEWQKLELVELKNNLELKDTIIVRQDSLLQATKTLANKKEAYLKEQWALSSKENIKLKKKVKRAYRTTLLGLLGGFLGGILLNKL